MKKFSLVAHLAAGLSYRLVKIDEQKVADAFKEMKPSKAIRQSVKIAQNIEKQNSKFMDVTRKVFNLKNELFEVSKKEYDAQSAGKTVEEKTKIAQEIRAKFDASAAEVQIANPTEEAAKGIVEFELSDEDYEMLTVLFELTVGTWDTDDSQGLGQKFFSEVAEAIEVVS